MGWIVSSVSGASISHADISPAPNLVALFNLPQPHGHQLLENTARDTEVAHLGQVLVPTELVIVPEPGRSRSGFAIRLMSISS